MHPKFLYRIMKEAVGLATRLGPEAAIPTEDFPVMENRTVHHWEREGKGPPAGHVTIAWHNNFKRVPSELFRPTFTDMGHCVAANAEPVENILAENMPYREVFTRAFKEELVGMPQVVKY